MTVYKRGRIVEFTNKSAFCYSDILVPGVTILPTWFQGTLYMLILFYLFLGISIISDVFMGAIEVITSQRRSFWRPDENGVMVKVSVNVWNPTIANLSLMALGSSAPEILLNVLETFKGLVKQEDPGELGAATIVGSAAFNFLVISGVSIAAVTAENDNTRTDADLVEDDTPRGVKKVRDLGVFTVTSIFSMIAYAWLLFVLWDGYVQLWEAIVTFGLFWVVMGCAYIADQINAKRTKERMHSKLGASGSEKVDEEQHGPDGQVANVNRSPNEFEPPIPYSAYEVYQHLIPEEEGKVWAMEEDVVKSQKMRQFLQKKFGTSSIQHIELAELKLVLEGEPLMKRAMYRKQVAIGSTRPVIKKGQKYR